MKHVRKGLAAISGSATASARPWAHEFLDRLPPSLRADGSVDHQLRPLSRDDALQAGEALSESGASFRFGALVQTRALEVLSNACTFGKREEFDNVPIDARFRHHSDEDVLTSGGPFLLRVPS
jgi:hypothetical protein